MLRLKNYYIVLKFTSVLLELFLTMVGQISSPYSAFNSHEKLLIIIVITLCGFLGPISGNIYIPLIQLTANKFNTSIETINGTVSVFMVVFAFFPLLWSSWADSIGRKPIFLLALIFFIISNTLIALLPANIAALYILRIFQAIGSSTMAVGVGCIADISAPEKRGEYISYYMVGPQLGPILGPIFGILGAKTDWRWNFALLGILGVISFLSILLLLPETLRSIVGDGTIVSGKTLHLKPYMKKDILTTNIPKHSKGLKVYLHVLREIPVLLCSLSGGIIFAGFYSMLLSFSRALSFDYGFSNTFVCISFLCPGTALVLGSLIAGRFSDYLRKQSDIDRSPEQRFFIQLVGQWVFAISLFIYAWILQAQVRSGYLFLPIFIAGFSLSAALITNTAYLSEYSKGQLATFVAVGNFFRNIGATVSSACVEILIAAMGYGWCMSIFGFCVAISSIFTILILKNGSKWRQKLTL